MATAKIPQTQQTALETTVPLDVITKRPRTPNIQYTCLTEEQLQNIAQKGRSGTLFAAPVYKEFKEGPFHKSRFVDSYSQHLTRTGSGYNNQRFCYVGEPWSRFPKQKYDTCEPLASVKWGTYKCGIKTAGYFYGEPTHKYTNIDMYRRNPTNTPGPVHMDYGRPGEGYYTQKYPSQTTWNESRVPLNRTKILQTVPSKTTAQYEEIEQYQKAQLKAANDQWPYFSEFTDKFALKTKVMPVMDNMARRKENIRSGRLLDEQIRSEKLRDEQTQHRKLQEEMAA